MWYDVNRFVPEMNHQLATYGFSEITATDFMRMIFPDGELENEGERTGKANSFIRIIHRETRKATSVFLHDDFGELPHTFDSDYDYFICGVSFVGRHATKSTAADLYALDIDIDHLHFDEINGRVEPTGMIRLGEAFGRRIPNPTAVVASGNGVHLWYVFSEKIHLYPDTMKRMKAVKDRFTTICWKLASDSSERPEYLSLIQFSRLPDSPTKRGDVCRGYTYDGGKKLTLDELNRYIPPDEQIKVYRKPAMSLEEAKALYPVWYERRIVKKQPQTAGCVSQHSCTPGMYTAWLSRRNQVKNGHRYFFIYVLAIYAYRCTIPRTRLVKDASDCAEYFSTRTPDDPLTYSDIQSAVKVFDVPEKCRISNRRVQQLCGISFEARTKKGKPKKVHLCDARASLAEKRKKSPDEYGCKRNAITLWRFQHPMGTPKECVIETGLSKSVVYKWWKSLEENYVNE